MTHEISDRYKQSTFACSRTTVQSNPQPNILDDVVTGNTLTMMSTQFQLDPYVIMINL